MKDFDFIELRKQIHSIMVTIPFLEETDKAYTIRKVLELASDLCVSLIND